MTIKIQAYQKQGVKSDKIEDEFEFCCWSALKEWLDGWKGNLYICSKCNDVNVSQSEGGQHANR